jgi:hypothetical protein
MSFPNRAEVEKSVRERFPWRTWDKRVQDIYVVRPRTLPGHFPVTNMISI